MREELQKFHKAIDINSDYKVRDSDLAEALNSIYFWQYDNSNSFGDFLFMMFQKADTQNRFRLSLAFPAQSAVFQAWYNWPTQAEFFSLANEWMNYWSLKNRINFKLPIDNLGSIGRL